jgi:hypothetical protein
MPSDAAQAARAQYDAAQMTALIARDATLTAALAARDAAAEKAHNTYVAAREAINDRYNADLYMAALEAVEKTKCAVIAAKISATEAQDRLRKAMETKDGGASCSDCDP